MYRTTDGSPNYIEFARQRGASYFDLGELWRRLPPEWRQGANEHFLDVVAARRDVIHLNVDVDEIVPGTSLAAEIVYLRRRLNCDWIDDRTLGPR